MSMTENPELNKQDGLLQEAQGRISTIEEARPGLGCVPLGLSAPHRERTRSGD